MSDPLLKNRPPMMIAPALDFRLTDQERWLFDGYAQENLHIAGTPFDYYWLDVANTEIDALYGEAGERAFRGPYKLTGWLEMPIRLDAMRMEGRSATWNPSAWVARKDVEDARIYQPKEGDVIQVWQIPFYESFSDVLPSNKPTPGSGFYFDVTEVETNGQMFDTPSFVGYKLTLKRRTMFSPERRLSPP